MDQRREIKSGLAGFFPMEVVLLEKATRIVLSDYVCHAKRPTRNPGINTRTSPLPLVQYAVLPEIRIDGFCRDQCLLCTEDDVLLSPPPKIKRRGATKNYACSCRVEDKNPRTPV